jgi:hypothetical protein
MTTQQLIEQIKIEEIISRRRLDVDLDKIQHIY